MSTTNTAARIAGAASVAALASVVVANYAVFERLIVRDDAAATLRNIAAHEALFRLGIAGFLGYALATMVVLVVLYEALRPASGGLALFGALGKLAYVFCWVLTSRDLVTVLRYVIRPGFRHVLGDAGLADAVMTTIGYGYGSYYVGLLFDAVGSAALCALLVRSRLAPRWLAFFGVLAYAWCALTTAGFLGAPGFGKLVDPWTYDTPMALFELALGVTLLTKGWSAEGALS